MEFKSSRMETLHLRSVFYKLLEYASHSIFWAGIFVLVHCQYTVRYLNITAVFHREFRIPKKV